MTKPKTTKPKVDRTKTKGFDNNMLDTLISGRTTQDQFFGEGGLFKQLKEALVERALQAELTHHLRVSAGGEAPPPEEEPRPAGPANRRNGSTPKRVKTDTGSIDIRVPRDRVGDFEPAIVRSYQRRLTGFDDAILSMYANGMSYEGIREHMRNLYGTEISRELVSEVTDSIHDEIRRWRTRPLAEVYPVVFLDALRVRILQDGRVENKAVYLAIGIDATGTKDVLGLWIEANEGARFWHKIASELHTRGVRDIFIAVVDGLKGLPEALRAVFPKVTVQSCIVHVLRASTAYVNHKDRRAVCAALAPVYRAPDEATARAALDEFRHSALGKKYSEIPPIWDRAWTEIIPFLAFPEEVRRLIYTTNAIESLNASMRRIVRAKGHFPSDDAAVKALYLGLRRIVGKWKVSRAIWSSALRHFVIVYPDRFPQLPN